MSERKLIVIGGSFGGIETLQTVTSHLPADLPAPILAVQHLGAGSNDRLAAVLDRAGPLRCETARDGVELAPGRVWVAPAGQHLVVRGGRVRLGRGPHINGVRPAIDPLFMSAALEAGPRAVGVVLSGHLDDGTAGCEAIRRAGGSVLVQDPDTALAPDMPQSVIDHVGVDFRLSPEALAEALTEQAKSPHAEAETPDHRPQAEIDRLATETDMVIEGSAALADAATDSELAAVSCPDCGGPMWVSGGKFARYHCHTGHTYTTRHLLHGLEHSEERALFAALRAMEERCAMLRRIHHRGGQGGVPEGSPLDQRRQETQEHIEVLRGLLRRRGGHGAAAPAGGLDGEALREAVPTNDSGQG